MNKLLTDIIRVAGYFIFIILFVGVMFTDWKTTSGEAITLKMLAIPLSISLGMIALGWLSDITEAIRDLKRIDEKSPK